MKNRFAPIITLVVFIGLLSTVYFSMMPHYYSEDLAPLSDFSVKRAVEHIDIMAEKPHYVGSEAHSDVEVYLQKELRELGLTPEIQEGTTLSDWGNLVKSRNIIAKIKGTNNSKALMLLSHYDSAPHSYSHGAADNATGVATILEGVRAYLHNSTPHENDILILFSDAEELGLNGAALFATNNNWAKEVGMVLNFEARGTAGPSYMLMEVNDGNAAMIKEFAAAKPKYPASNSLMYSIYKMLPNDTDLTVFREQAKIPGFNFAFIDDHFNYHTAQDDSKHLSHNSVAHQGSYLVPMLNHFGNADLKAQNSSDDDVYFNTPFYFFHYSFSWNYILIAFTTIVFLFLLFIGLGKRILSASEIGKGSIVLVASLLVVGLSSFLLWKFLLVIYPEYTEILQGFTYNGHSYIVAFIALSIAIAFLFYAHAKTEATIINYSVAPITLWLIINLGLAIYLPGAGFFIIPVLFALIMFGFYVVTQRSSLTINLLAAVPTLFILVPFIVLFPIGLGLKILFGASILAMLVFVLILPLLGSFTHKWIWSAALFIVAFGALMHAHLNSNFGDSTAKPNSLLYVYNVETDKAVWASYDKILDDWTKIYITDTIPNPRFLNNFPLFSKYNSEIVYTSEALVRNIPEPTVSFETDSIVGNNRFLKIRITPNRRVNRIDIFANENLEFRNFKANKATALGQKGAVYARKGKKLLSYYVVDNDPLVLDFTINKDAVLDMSMMESSFDLMTNPLFGMRKRNTWMMPKPFILTDAVVQIKKINPVPRLFVPQLSPELRLRAEDKNDTIRDMDNFIIQDNSEL